MELQDYLAILRKRWLSIAIITLLATAAAVGATVLVTPTYTARAQVYVSVRTGGTTSDLLQGSNFTVRQVKSYTDLVTTPLVLTPVIENLDLPTTPDELAKSITASSPLDTSLINISATHEDPQVASDIANATAESLSTNVTALEKPTDGESPVQISTVRIASAPLEPSAPNAKLNVALGLLVGLALGFGIAVLRQVLDTRIRTVEDIRAVTQASVMTVMTHDDDAVQHPLIVQSNPHSPRAEAFRRLRTNLQFLDVADRLESIVVTSALPSEGKSTVAINLAITLADAGSRVALVDADLRRPSVAEYMGIEGRVGLTTVLIGQAKLEHVIQPWGGGNLHVLPSGQVPPNPSEMVGSHAMGWVLGELVKEFDVVVVDAPPLLPVTDAAILARLAGGALVVAGANRLHRAELSEALEGLDAVGARVLGLVLNHLARKQSDAYAYYGVETRDPKRRRSASEKRRSTRVTAKQAAAGPVRRTVSERQADEGRLDDLLGSEGAPTSPRRWPGDPVV